MSAKKLGRRALAALALCVLASGCRREQWREVELEVPGLTEANRADVLAAVGKYAGVDMKSPVFDFNRKTLTLRYDTLRVAQTNLRMAIEAKGVAVTYPANTTGVAGYIDTRRPKK